MKTRVKLEASDKAGRYAYTDGLTITLGKDTFGPEELGYTVVTADKSLASSLKEAGYSVRVSDSRRKWAQENLATVSTVINIAKKESFERICASRGKTPHAVLKEYIEGVVRDE